MRRTTLTLLLVTLLGLGAWAGCGGGDDTKTTGTAATADTDAGAARTGSGTAPAAAPAAAPSRDFVLSDLKGRPLSLAAYRGDVVILDFWATWCGPCKMVMPSLQKINDEHADEGIHVVALSVDRQGPSVVRRFIDRYGYTFPVAMADNALQRAYGGIRSIPTTFIIGPDGTVAEQMIGAHPLQDYLDAARRARQDSRGT